MRSSFLLYDIFYWFTPTLKRYTLLLCNPIYFNYIYKLKINFKYFRHNKFSIGDSKK